MESRNPTDLKQNKFTSTWFHQAVITYADDTTWLANSKKQLEEMLRVAEDLYILNDIQINIAKSKLLVINSSSKLEDRAVHFMHQKVQAKKRHTLFRFLGAWLSEKAQNMEISKRLSTYNPNNISIMPDKADIKEDNRIKDWVLIEEKKNSMTIRQVLEKCSSCELNSNKGKEVYLSWIQKEDIQGVYSKIQNVANQKVLPVPKEVIAKKKIGNVEALVSNLLDLQLTVEASLARHLVKSQVLNKALFLDLLEALEQNTLNRKEVYKFTWMASFLRKFNAISYKYLSWIIDENEFKVLESIYNSADGSYTILVRHG
ncbi:14461_t:CDS:2 [Gigaspora margarita]|uniref:14461_t:CDS:1 n=1 Tax=Gigaspora margarita TaxID=4874 RepID=A0ABM8VXQ3_GIGMA|nr:14461_t:CDS:2 [Gigaspora margarita]